MALIGHLRHLANGYTSLMSYAQYKAKEGANDFSRGLSLIRISSNILSISDREVTIVHKKRGYIEIPLSLPTTK